MASACVIGGGPAGAVAGIVLARHGWKVVLLEQKPFPRSKVCGECLSDLGFQTLANLDLTRELSRHAVQLTATRLVRGGESLRIDLPRPMWGYSRGRLDETLLAAAAQAGVEILQPERMTAIQPGETPVVRRANGPDLTCDVVVLADGRSATTAGLTAVKPTGDFGIKTHLRGVRMPANEIWLVGMDRAYVGLAAIEGGLTNVAIGVRQELLAEHRGDLQKVFESLVAQNAILGRAVVGAESAGEWLGSPLPRYAPRGNWPQNVYPVGNALAALEPVGGEGMGLAMASAAMVAGGIVAGESATAIFRRASALWRIRRPACRGVARLLMHPAAGALLPLGVSVGPMIAALMGKSANRPSVSFSSVG